MGDQAHRPSRLILVKHGLPRLEPGAPPSSWELAQEGREQAQRLAGRLAEFSPTAIVSSLEPKAAQTADILASELGLVAGRDACIGEQLNDSGPFTDPATFQAAVARMFSEPARLVMGEETADEAYNRFSAAIERQLLAHPLGALVAVSHGRVISLWISRRYDIDPLPFWRALVLGSAVVVADEAPILLGD